MSDFSGMITKEDTFYTVEQGDSNYAGINTSAEKGTMNYLKIVIQTSQD